MSAARSPVMDGPVYDVLGIGFGPANLALAAAIAEHNDKSGSPHERRLRSIFVESHPTFLWHPGMMIEGSRMQINFLKDLATMRNPASPYTFLCYLHEHGRMASFINCSTFTPTRQEFSDYLSWVASKVTQTPDRSLSVEYSEVVESIEPVLEANGCDVLRVVSRSLASNKPVSRLTRNVVVSTGGQARFPPQLEALTSSERPDIVHSSAYLSRLDDLLGWLTMPTGSSPLDSPLATHVIKSTLTDDLRPPTPPSSEHSETASPLALDVSPPLRARVAVIGAGQSAAEIFLHLRSKLPPTAEIDLIMRHGALRPSDDSGFSNETFDPASTDHVYALASTSTLPTVYRTGLGGASEPRRGSLAAAANGARERVLLESQPTNYAVVNSQTLEAVYDAMYAQRVDDDIAASDRTPAGTCHSPHARLRILPHRQILEAERERKQIRLHLRHMLHDERSHRSYDAVICATGYDRQGGRKLISAGLGGHFEGGEEAIATCHVERSYRLKLPANDKAGRPFRPAVWMQGSQEATHGISDSLLSVVGIRAGEILSSILAEGNVPRAP